MGSTQKKRISRIVRVFHGRALPESEGLLVGYGALIDAFALEVPLPDRLALVSRQHRRYDTDEWSVYRPRHAPDDTIAGQLTFALRYEGVELAVLRARFLERYDRMRAAIDARFDMPGHTADLLIRFLRQNDGVLSKRAREKEFRALRCQEYAELEILYAEIFEEPE